MTPFLKKYCANDDEVKLQQKAFHDFFKSKRFSAGYDFSFERRSIDDALFVEEGELTPNNRLNKKRIPDSLPCLSQALWRQKLNQVGKSLYQLLNDLFDASVVMDEQQIIQQEELELGN
jgi:hypothetical protein